MLVLGHVGAGMLFNIVSQMVTLVIYASTETA